MIKFSTLDIVKQLTCHTSELDITLINQVVIHEVLL